MKSIAVFCVLLVTSTAAQADCKPQVSGTGTGFNKAAAELAARLSWNTNAKNYYGITYASWPKSNNKSSNTVKIKFGSWKSTFYANPCN